MPIATETTRNRYAPDPSRAKFKALMRELVQKKNDPDFIRYVMDQEGYDLSAVDEELNTQYGFGMAKQAQATQQTGINLGVLDTNSQDGKEMAGAISQINQLEELTKRLNTESGVDARVKGVKSSVGAFLGTDTDAETYKDLVQNIGLVARSLGNKGVLTDVDIQRIIKSMPEMNDSKEVTANKLTFLKQTFNDVAGAEVFLGLNGQTAPQAQSQEPPKRTFTDQDAFDWAQANPNDPQAAQVMQILQKKGFQAPGQKTPVTAPTAESQKEDKPFLYKVGEFMGLSKFGEGMGTTLFLWSKEGRELQQKAQEGDQAAIDALTQIMNDAPTAREVVGSAANTALWITGGQLAQNLGGALGAGATAMGAGAKVAGYGGKLAAGTIMGAAAGTASGLSENKSGADLAGSAKMGAVTGGILTAAAIGAEVIAGKMKSGAERLYNSAIKPSTDDLRKAFRYKGNTLGREMLNSGKAGSAKKLMTTAQTEMQQVETKLQSILEQSDDVVTKKDLAAAIADDIAKWKKVPTGKTETAITRASAFLDRLPDEMNLAQANQLKREIYYELGDTAYKLDAGMSGDREAGKSIARAIKNTLESKTAAQFGDQVKKLNMEHAKYLKLEDRAVDILARAEGRQIIGIGTVGNMIGRALSLVTGGEAGKTYSALAIDKTANKLYKLAQNNKANAITTQMIIRMLDESENN